MNATQQKRLTKPVLMMSSLLILLVAAFSASTILAQTAIDGYWGVNGGAWGTRSLWGYESSLRPAAATVSLNTRATATAVRVGDKITSYNVTSSGSNYTSPPNVIVGAPNNVLGVQATAIALLGPDGQVSGVVMENPGSGYTATPSVTISGEITQVTMNENGSGYTSIPSVYFNGGGGYTSPPTVTFRGGLGGGAVATAAVSSNRVTSISLSNGGSGYSAEKPPTVAIITTTGGSGATAEAVVNASGVITAINVTNQGTGYNNSSPPSVFIGSPAPDDLATGTAVVLDGQVIAVEINNPGSGYTAAPQIFFSGGGATGNGNVQGTVDLAGGSVAGVTITNMGGAVGPTNAVATLGAGGSLTGIATSNTPAGRGWGFISAPTVLIGAPLVRQATASATQSGGMVTAVNVGNPGAGYLSAPAVTFANTGWRGYTAAPRVRFTSNGITGALATAVRNATNETITSVTIQDGGENYTVPPTVSFIGGNGLGAAATAVIAGGVVTSINMNNVGSGYGSVPTVTLVGGGGSGATAQAVVSNRQVTAINIVSGGTGYTTAPTVVITSQQVSNPATATAVLSAAGKVTSVTMNSLGSGYTSVPTVVFTASGVSYAVATASAPNGQLSAVTLNYPGAGYSVAPTVSLDGNINLTIGGVHGTATAVISGGSVSAVNVTTPGGAIRAVATTTLTPQGNLASVTVTNAGTGYTINPNVTIGAPTGIGTSVQPAPGGVGAYLTFNRDIGGNIGITLDAARIVGSLNIGDFGAEDYVLNMGTGGVNNTLTFDMGILGAGKSFLNKTQGDQDVINAPVILQNQLNVRITTGRLTLNNGIGGTGTLVTSGNSVLTIRGQSTESQIGLWLWNRGTTNTGAQVELGSTGSNAIGNVRLGNASFGTAGHAVLQLLENRNSLPDRLDQISDTATVIVDAATNRWGYFKLMGGDETIGNIIDVGNALVLENMEGETVNSDAVLTLGGNNLDSYIGGFARNRSGGSGTGTLGITKNGTGELTLQGGNISYTGQTLLNAGTLNLINTTNFGSSINAAEGTRLNVTATTTVNFGNTVVGKSELWKYGASVLNLNSGQTVLNSLSITDGSVLIRPGAATLRGGQNIINGSVTLAGDSGVNRILTVNDSLSVGSIDFNGRYGQQGAALNFAGFQNNLDNIGNFSDASLESSQDVKLANANLIMAGTVSSSDRVVQTTTTTANPRNLILTNHANIVIGSILTLKIGVSADANKRFIPPGTRILAVDQTSRVLTLSADVKLEAGTEVTLTYSSNTDGSLRGESLNFTQVVHDGRKYVAVTSKGTVHTSIDGATWSRSYADPSGVSYRGLSWTGEKFYIVGDQGRLLTSADGYVWTVLDSGLAVDLRDVTSTQTKFTGNLASNSTTISNVTSAATFLPGTPVYGLATVPDSRIVSINAASRTVTIDSNALETATTVDFGFFIGDTSTTVSPKVISNVFTAQYLLPGEIQGSGIPATATIQSVDWLNNRLILTQPATLTSPGVRLNTLTGNLVRGNVTITNVTNFNGLVKGMVLTGQGIVPQTRIVEMNTTLATITLSQAAVITGSAVPMGVYTGRLTNGSTTIDDVTSLGAILPDTSVKGLLVAEGAYVVSSTANSLTLSKSTTASSTGAKLRAGKFERLLTGSFTSGNALVTNVSPASGLSAGMQVALPGVIPAQAVIQIVNGSNVTLSVPALQTQPNASFRAGFDLVITGRNGTLMTSASGEALTWKSQQTNTTRDLNAVDWSGTQILTVGERGRMLISSDGIAWTRTAPPLTDTDNVIVGVDQTNKTISLNNPAIAAGSQASFSALKANSSVSSSLLSNATGMHSLRAGLPVTSDFGFSPGTTISSVNVSASSMVLSTSAIATGTDVPIRTLTGFTQLNSLVVSNVSDFKGLMVGMSIHSSAYSGTAQITGLNVENRQIYLSRAPTQSGLHSFGTFYGNITNNSATVTNLSNLRSFVTLRGMANLTAGKSIPEVSAVFGSGLSISGYNSNSNTLTLAGGTALNSSSNVPIYSLTGRVTNGSNVITNVSDMNGLAVGMNIMVSGSLAGTTVYETYVIDSVNVGSSTLTISGNPNLNASALDEQVPLALFFGTTVAGSNSVTNLSNFVNQGPPVLRLPDLRDVVWTGTQFIVVGDYGALLTSANGTTWTPRNIATGRDLLAVGISGSQFMAAGEDGIILRSTDGASWTEVRRPDSPALNDVRHIQDIRSVIAFGGKTLALGSGGLATTDTASWSTLLNDTFSGSQINLDFGGNLGGGGITQAGIFQISNVFTTSSTTSGGSGVLVNTNNTNRIDDTAVVLSRGGDFRFLNNGAAVAFSEVIGGLNLAQGHLRIMSARAGSGGSNILTFGKLERQPGATVDFMGVDFSAGSLSAVIGSLGQNAQNRILFTQNPVLKNGIIGGWATIDNEWATYNATNGVVSLATYDTGDQTGWVSTGNVKLSADRTLTANTLRAINSLNTQGRQINLNGGRLSIESGGILSHTGTGRIGPANGVGTLTMGLAMGVSDTLNVINNSTIEINVPIRDFLTTINAPATAKDAVTITMPNVVGLLVGMEVSGNGLLEGTRILSIDAGNNRITLSAPVQTAIPANTAWSFAGGSVGLMKSGSGLMTLVPGSTYTGKTYLNQGITRITAITALGATPEGFTPDQIQLNGGVLQVGHIIAPGATLPLPNYSLAINDQLRGISVGKIGGRIEVGQSNPANNTGSLATSIPIVNLTITNPINAQGVLELAVRSLSQKNTLVLGRLAAGGDPASTNVYAGGIKSEAGFNGDITILGNNVIGGINKEGSNMWLYGNNDFTAPIRSILGDLTIDGTNTWFGKSVFEETTIIRGGTLKLLTTTALGTGGLDITLQDSGKLELAGLAQTIRKISGVLASSISNDGAPDGFTGYTNLTFNLQTNQTFTGSIKDGFTVSNTAVAPLKLIKTGPGILTLTSESNDFSAGLEILEGGINVTSIGRISSDSALGSVETDDPALLLIDKSVLSFTPTGIQQTDRSFTMGAGPNGAALVANGTSQRDTVLIGFENRDVFGINSYLSSPIAFKDAGVRTLTLSGSGRGDNTFQLELRDSAIGASSGLLKAGQGTWVLNKAAPYSGITTVNDGTLVVTKNDALGTVGANTVANASTDRLTGNLPNGIQVTFPQFFDTTLPQGIAVDTAYYVVNSDGVSFQISKNPGGAVLDLSTAGQNVKYVAKIDALRSTAFDDIADTFTGNLPNGAQVTFNTRLVPGVGTPVAPGSLLTNTVYYVVNSSNGLFQVSTTENGAPLDFSSGTPGSLYYTTNAASNPNGGVNVTAGNLELRNVNYLTPESIRLEGGAVIVPADTRSIWSGDIFSDVRDSRISIGQGAQLTLNGNLLGGANFNQEGEGTMIFRGEMITPTTNINNNVREYAVRAGTLILDYSVNNGSKLSDVANLRLGGSRRGGTIVLSGGSHQEIVSQLVLEAGASKIYRESGTGTINFNNISRSTGSSLYVDLSRIATTDVLNNNGILGAWAIMRDAVTEAFWIIPGNNTGTYTVTASPADDVVSGDVSANGLATGTLVRFTSTGTLPGGILENTDYYIKDTVLSPDATQSIGFTISPSLVFSVPAVNITSAGTGSLSMTTQTVFTVNVIADTLTTPGDHRLANGMTVRLSSRGTLPAGLDVNTDYYVVDQTQRSFRLSTSVDGPPVNIANSGAGIHFVETHNSEKRVGTAGLVFSINPSSYPGTLGNQRVKVAIVPQPTTGEITSQITGSGQVSDPYVYTLFTTQDKNTNNDLVSFVASDSNNPAAVSGKLILLRTTAAGTTANAVPDLAAYGEPTFLGNGSNDNGRSDLGWARNEGTNDGAIIPLSNSAYRSDWGGGGLNNTSVTNNISVDNRNTYSLRFAAQNAFTVALNSGVNSIMSGGILVSPSVGPNDSTIGGAARLSTGGQGNLQNLLIHQYNDLGSLVIGARITNRAKFTRTARLSGVDRRTIAGLVYTTVRNSSGDIDETRSIRPGQTITGPAIPASTTVVSVDDNHTITVSQDMTAGSGRGEYTFTGGALPGAGIKVVGSYSNNDRRRIMGVTVTNLDGSTTVSTTDLYVGMPISGEGIPVNSTISFIFNEGDIQVSTNHFFTGNSTSLTFDPVTGIEKLGAGTLVLSGDNDYTGTTFIADGTVRAQNLADGGIRGSLGASNAASANLFFNGGELQYVGDNTRTNRGFQLSEFATLNIGHERTSATFTGAVVGTDRLEKSGPGTLVFSGNIGLEAIRVEQGKLLLQAVDTNFTPAGFSASNFSTTALTSLRLAGGVLELRGTPEGNVTQNFGSQLFIEEGASEIRVTSVLSADPNNLSGLSPFRSTILNIMGQEELTSVVRMPGGSLQLTENPESGAGDASINLFLPLSERQKILPYATYRNVADQRGGVNDYALVDLTSSEVTSFQNYDTNSSQMNAGTGWGSTRQLGLNLDITEGGFSPDTGLLKTFTGTISTSRFVNTLRYLSNLTSLVTINAGQTLEVASGAILLGSDVRGGAKTIAGPGNITGGLANAVNSDFIIHHYNPVAPFTIGANITDKVIRLTNSTGTVGRGTLLAGQAVLKVETGSSVDFFRSIRVGMTVTGPGLPSETTVLGIDSDFRRILLSQEALTSQTNQIYSFAEPVNFIQTGLGTTILSGNNVYTGKTFLHGGVLRLNSANAVPGGIGNTGGTSAIVVEGGVLGLGAGNFTRGLGSGIDQIFFKGNGGFAAYGANREVNLGAAAIPELLRFGNNGFVPDGSSLILGSRDATHTLSLLNPLDLSAFSQAINVVDGNAEIEGQLMGSLSGLGRMIKFGLGTLRLGVSNLHSGGIEIAEGRLIAANVENVFGTGSSGPILLGTSRTNTDTRSAIELVMEGGNVAKNLIVGTVNAPGSNWVSGGVVDSEQGFTDVGKHASMLVVEGFPAIAYYDATAMDLKYVRALDARGTRWGTPVRVASRGDVGQFPSLSIINGNPAISYYDATNGSLMYVRATDAPGVFWGTPVPVFAQTSGVLAVAVQPLDGKVLVGGTFTQIDGVARTRLIRLNNDGLLDTSFEAFIIDGEVRTIIVQPDGKIVVGGTFNNVRLDKDATNNLTRTGIARFNANGTLDTAFDARLNGSVNTITRLSDGRLLLGGSFTTVAGIGRTRMTRLSAAGALDTSFASPDIRNGEVRDIAIDQDGSYVICGNFTSVRGDGNRNRLARITSVGGLDTSFNPDANNDVNAVLVLPDEKILVGGAFGAFAGGVQSRTRLARLEKSGVVDQTFAREVNGTVNTLRRQQDGKIIVAGLFSEVGTAKRNFLARLQVDSSIDESFDPDPDQQVRDIALMADGKIVLGGLFTNVSNTVQQVVARLTPSGAADVGFSRFPVNVGQYSSLLFVNGAPAIAYRNLVNQSVEYVRSSDANGTNWANPQVIADDDNDNGVGISMIIANIGGDVLTKDNRNTVTVDDDEVTISGTVATIGTPLIVFGDATNSRLKVALANNSTGTVNTALGVTNWSDAKNIPNTGNVGPHFSVSLVDRFPAIAYQRASDNNLMFIRATNVAGITNNLRDPDTLEILRRTVVPSTDWPGLIFSTTGSWADPITLDNSGNVGRFPSLALINGQPTTVKSRPAVTYYDATNGNLKYIAAPNFNGDPLDSAQPHNSPWGAPQVLAETEDVGQYSSLTMVDGLPAVAYYNVSQGDLAFLMINDASGFTRLSFSGDTNWQGNVSLQGTLLIAPAAGQTATISGILSGAAGFKLISEGILNLTNGLNGFGTSLASPGVTTASGVAINGAAIIRSGSLHFGSTGALGNATVEMGDQLPNVLVVDRATTFGNVTDQGGSFIALHDGQSRSDNGPGAFVKVAATIDGQYYGLVETQADFVTHRFTGSLADGTAIYFTGQTLPTGVEREIVYYVMNPTATDFQVSLSPLGTANRKRVDILDIGNLIYYIEKSKLDATILVKDQNQNPEQNGLFRFVVEIDNENLAVNVMNLVRVAAFDAVNEMKYGLRVKVQNGTSAGKSYFLARDVLDVNVSAIQWVEERDNLSLSLLASAGDVTIANAIDINAISGTGNYFLGASNSVTTGQVAFSGPITLQNLSNTAVDQKTLTLTSSTNTGYGVTFSGIFQEADGGVRDRISLIKTGAGTVTLASNNNIRGAISINEGTLLVKNIPLSSADSATGFGAVTVNAGGALGGTGRIAGPVVLTGSLGNVATLRPGDPTENLPGVELLTINQPLTIGPNSVLEFSIGVENQTKLAGTTIQVTSNTAKIVVQAEPGYKPVAGTQIDLLDFNSGGFTLLSGVKLLDLLQLPVTTVWNTSQFLTTGRIISEGDSIPTAVTADPVSQTILQGGNHTFNVSFIGTAPVTFQWMKDGVDIFGGTSATLTITGATQASEGLYSVRVMNPVNPGGAVSNAAQLTVDWPVGIAVNLPANKKGSINEQVKFKVIPTGEGPLTYQWKKGDTNIGTNSPEYIIPNAAFEDAGSYSVVITGPSFPGRPANSITSAVSNLIVTEGIPVVSEQPESESLLVGGNLLLSALGGGGDPTQRTFQWFRNGVAIPGATTNTYNLCEVSTASSGDYTFRVTTFNPISGKFESATSDPPASIFVADNTPKILAGQLGKTVSLSVSVGATPKFKTPGYRWLRNGGPLPSDGRFTGGNTKKLTIKTLKLDDSATYTCEITGAPGTATIMAGTHHLRVYNIAPKVITTTPPPVGIVGGAYSWKIPVESDVAELDEGYLDKWAATPSAYAVKGLPSGLTVNKTTGLISGFPRVAASNRVKYPNGFPITITVSNAYKPSSTWKTFIDVLPLPVAIAGTYAGPVARGSVNGQLGGRFDMTITSSGAISGKITLGSLSARSFKGSFSSTKDLSGNATGLGNIKVKIPATKTLPALMLEFGLSVSAAESPLAPDTLIVNASVDDCGNSRTASFTGWRNKWSSKPVAGVTEAPTIYRGGLYNIAMALPDDSHLPEAERLVTKTSLVPQGAGFASFTVGTSGTTSVAGRTADDEAFTCALPVGPTGQMFLFRPLYTTKVRGSLHGGMQIVTAVDPNNNDVNGALTWVRPPNPAKVTAKAARVYRSGFGTDQIAAGVPPTTVTSPVPLVVFGGRYIAPPTKGLAPLPVIFGLTPVLSPETNAKLNFTETGEFPDIITTPLVDSQSNPDVEVTVGAKSKATTTTLVSVNPSLTKVTVVPSTGSFTGSFNLQDTVFGLIVKRPATFRGIIIPKRPAGGEPPTAYGMGYFMVPQKPAFSGDPASTTPRISGMTLFEAK